MKAQTYKTMSVSMFDIGQNVKVSIFTVRIGQNVNLDSAGSDFSRQNLTSVDVRF